MSFIDQYFSAVLFADRDDFREVGEVSIHAVNTFHTNDHSFCLQTLEGSFQMLRAVMAEYFYFSPGQPDSIIDGRMGKDVNQCDISGPQ